jgi:chloramphenicol O-acetyltransferase type A
MPHYLDLTRWTRKATFDFFRGYDNPYFNVCVPLRADALVEFSRASDAVPFSLACLYLALRAANEYEPLRYRLQDGRVLVHERLHAASTALQAEDRLAFTYWDYDDSFATFRDNAAAARASLAPSPDVLETQDHRTDLIHFTSLPWVSFTSISHARDWRREDAVPKIVFGRYHASGDRVLLPFSVEVHHALMDGLHVSRYLERLQGYVAEPEGAIGRP